MKRGLFIAITVSASVGLLSGCVTKAQAKADARSAFLAGQQQALQQAQTKAGPNVTVIGPVKYTVVPWTSELTVAGAIIAADYFASSDPREIIILRNGQQISVDPKRLLNGEDQPLQSGDVLQLKP
jgi:hypothetical protein